MSPVAVANTPTPTVESLKATAAAPQVDLLAFAHFDPTPAIGTEFEAVSTDGKPVLSIQDVLADPARVAALGRLVSERGVVFFRNGEITPLQQQQLVIGLSKAGGAPPDSTLHIHPLTFEGSPLGDQITWISNENRDIYYGDANPQQPRILQRVAGKTLWLPPSTPSSSSLRLTIPRVPSDYASLAITELPKTGGDTLWASAYEAYDRLSPALQQTLEGLTAVHSGDHFHKVAERAGKKLRTEVRGNPLNVGADLDSVHPVIRTNPVTGWKGLFVNPVFTRRIVELTKPESDALLAFLYEHITGNHDLQVRFRWTKNALAIWDNRSTFHAATQDVDEVLRAGPRSVTVGEAPYFDPKSVSRRAALAEREAAATAPVAA